MAVGAEESTAKGVNIGATTFNGTATAKFTLPDATAAHTLTFAYSDTAIAKVTDAVGTGSATELKDSGSGTYVIDATSGLTVKIATDAFVDGTLSADEISVTTGWNNGSDVKVTDSTATWSDNIQVNHNDEGNLVKWKLDDTHYYAFLLGTDYQAKVLGPEETISVEGVTGTFTNENSVAFSTDGINYSVIGGTVKSGTINIDSTYSAAYEGTQSITTKYTSSSKQLTITPGTGAFTAKAEELASISFTTGTDGTYTGAAITASATAATGDTFGVGDGSLKVEFTTPSYASGVSTSAETYSIQFGSIQGYTSTGSRVKDNDTAASYWQGAVTVQAGTSTVEFSATDLTAWLNAGSTAKVGSTSGLPIALSTDGSLIYKKTSSATAWYKATATLGTNGTYTYAADTSDTNPYTGAYLTYTKTSGSEAITYYSTNQLGTGITADDMAVTFSLSSAGGVSVTKAARYDADAGTATDAGTYKGDGVTGQMDAYTLDSTKGAVTAWSASNKDLSKTADFLGKIATVGGKTATVSTTSGTLTNNDSVAEAGTALTLNTSDEFSGITYYKVTAGTIDEKVGNTAATVHDAYAPGTPTAWLAPEIKSARSAGHENDGSPKVSYALALDSNGTPYVDVRIVDGSMTSISTALNGKTNKYWTSFNIDGVSDSTVSDAATKIGFASTSEASDDVPTSFTSGSYSANGTDWSAVSNGLTASGAGNYYDGDNDLYVWVDVDSDGGSKWIAFDQFASDASGSDSPIKTGNLSVQLGSNIMAVVPIKQGAIETTSKAAAAFINVNGAWNLASGTKLADLETTTDWDKATTTTPFNGMINETSNNGDAAGLKVGDTYYTVVYNSTTSKATALPSWAGTEATLATAALEGTLQIYEGVDLGVTGKTFAIALDTAGTGSGDGTVLAVATSTTTGDTFTWTALDGIDGKELTYSATDKSFSLTQTGISGFGATVDGTYTLDLSTFNNADNLGALGKLAFTFSSGKLTKIDLLNASGQNIGEGYTVSALNSSGLKATGATAYDADSSDGFTATTTSKTLYIYKGTTPASATLAYTLTFVNDISAAASNGTELANVQTAIASLSIAVASDAAGVAGAALADAANAAVKTFGGDDAYTLEGTEAAGKVSVSAVDDTDLQAALTRDGAITGTLANASALTDGQRIIKLTLGNAAFYLVGTFGDLPASSKSAVSITSATLYNAAGVKVSDLSQGLGLDGTSLKLSADGSKSVAVSLYYDPTDETYSLATADATSLSALANKVTFDDDGNISAVTSDLFQNAELVGKAETAYSKITTEANAEVTSASVGQKAINSGYVVEQYETEEAFKTALSGTLAGISYVEHEGGNYTGIIALGSDATNGALKNTVSLVDQSGTTVTSLYAKYSFGSDASSFKLEGLYTDKGASSESANTNIAIGEDGKSIIFGTGDTALTYSLSAASYSDVTISLTSGTITYDNTTISLTSGAIVNSKTDVDTTAVAFRTESSSSTGTTTSPAFQFELTSTTAES